MKWCWLGIHKWAKWNSEKWSVENLWRGQRWLTQDDFQVRYCEHCNKREMKR